MKLSPFKLIVFGLCSLYSGFLLLCLWFDNLVTPEIFAKLSITFGILLALLTIYYLLYHLNSEKELKKNNYIKD